MLRKNTINLMIDIIRFMFLLFGMYLLIVCVIVLCLFDLVVLLFCFLGLPVVFLLMMFVKLHVKALLVVRKGR